ncbi:MAG: hypothetical protein P4L86_07715, partial [Mycobacterium sp.]|nr:hypothetical protein [Mycobacterium sp.]
MWGRVRSQAARPPAENLMRPGTQIGLAVLLAAALLAAATGVNAQQPAPSSTAPAATPATATPSDSTTSQPAATPPAAAQPDTKTDSKPDTASKPLAAKSAEAAKTDVLPSPGEALDPHIKKGSEDDVDAIGTRNIGGRGVTNWYSTNWEIGTGKQYSMEIEKSAHLITDPVVVEYVNRVGQNIVKNSDCKVPFTIKIIDSDEI